MPHEYHLLNLLNMQQCLLHSLLALSGPARRSMSAVSDIKTLLSRTLHIILILSQVKDCEMPFCDIFIF